MIRRFLLVFWPLSAALAITLAVVLGFYGWAPILIWSVVVLPVALYQRQEAKGHWPSKSVVNLWVLTVAINLAAGILPPLASGLTLGGVAGSVLGWVLVVLIWSGVVAALLLLVILTAAAMRQLMVRAPSAA